MTNENQPTSEYSKQQNESLNSTQDHNINNVKANTTSEFSHIEPVTPKHNHQDESSFLNTAKDRLSFFTKKKKEDNMSEQQINNTNHVNHSAQASQTTVNSTTTSEKKHCSFKEKITHPEKWKVLQILPPKYRRIIIILLLILFILCLIMWLKPASHPIEVFEQEHQQNASNIPTQFKPITIEGLNDEPAENTQTLTVNNPEQNQIPQGNVINLNDNTPSLNQEEYIPVTSTDSDIFIDPVLEENNSVPNAVIPPVEVEHKVQAVQQKVQKQNVHHVQKPKAKIPSSQGESIFDAAEKANLIKESKAQSTSPRNLRANNRILRFRAGVSLMQLFRENNLNISDVMAMSKVKGAGNKLSQFKAGDKIHVIPGQNGHVAELILNNGSRFIRQSNGTYRFQR